MSTPFLAGNYPGETEAHRRLSGLGLTESRYARDVAMEAHAHRLPFLHIVLGGGVREDSDAAKGDLAVAEVVYHPPHSPHATSWRAGGAGFAMKFGIQRAAEFDDWGVLPDRPLRLPPGLVSGLMLAARRELHRPDGAALAAESLLVEVLAELRRLPASIELSGGAPRWLRQAREAVCDTFADPPTLGEVAASVSIHPAHLARAFRQHFGETMGDCVRRRRLGAACRQIAADHHTPLTDVALEAGFADQAHFSRTFKRQVGMTPSEYAQQVRPRVTPGS